MTGLNALHQLKGNGIWAVKFMERDINGKNSYLEFISMSLRQDMLQNLDRQTMFLQRTTLLM